MIELTSEKLAARCKRLRNAWDSQLRRRSLSSIASTLERVADAWRTDPHWENAARQIDSLFPFEMAKPSLDRLLQGWRSQTLAPLLQEIEPSDPDQYALGYPLSLHLLAGNTPLLGWESIAASLLARSCAFLKLSSRETAWTPLLVESLRQIDPELGDCIDYDAWPGEDTLTGEWLSNGDCIIAYGSDQTLQKARALSPIHAPFYAYGSRFSIAFISAPNADPTPLALDCVRYYQLGCLSPQLVFVEGNAIEYAQKLAEAIEREMKPYAPPLGMSEAIAIRREREASFFLPGAQMWGRDELSWSVLYSETPNWNVLGVFGMTSVCPVESLADFIRRIEPFASRLQAIGYDGELSEEWKQEAIRLGVPRVCPVGTMQTPPFNWFDDNRSLIQCLLRRVRVER